jgi:hypothetical protein
MQSEKTAKKLSKKGKKNEVERQEASSVLQYVERHIRSNRANERTKEHHQSIIRINTGNSSFIRQLPK